MEKEWLANHDQRFLANVEDPAQRKLEESWRLFRIMGEFVDGFDTLAPVGPAVSIFGSARTKPDNPAYEQAVATAKLLGETGFSIITGGGPGIMEAANKGARDGGAHSIGCNIELPFEQQSNPYVDTLLTFKYFFARKVMFVKYASGFVIFPGGFGTMDELFESLTLMQCDKVRDFPLVLFGSSYWAGLLDWIRDSLLGNGAISPGDIDRLYLTDSPQEVVDHIVAAVGKP